MKKTGAQILCEGLIKRGVEVIFGFPGGVLLPLYDILPQYPGLRHILVRHEQGAAHAADGYARATDRVGVCLATSGPGACNLVTGIANAYMDSSPVIAITGQVARSFIGRDAFQETDITGITLPITKHNYLVLKTEELAQIVEEAFHIALEGRPGPVLIDIPKDVFTEEVEVGELGSVNSHRYRPKAGGHAPQIEKAVKAIDSAQHPIIISGRGVIISHAAHELSKLVSKAQIPVTTTLLGIGSFPGSSPMNLGMLGMHGNVHANLAVDHADVIIAVGMRFDDRATARFDSFAPEAKIIHIDIDPAEIGKNIPCTIPIVGDAKIVLREIVRLVQPQTHDDWLAQIEEWQEEHPLPDVEGGDELLPQYVIRKIWEQTRGNAIIVTGVGQHQMWAAQHFTCDRPGSFISSGGLATMGFELPAAMGAKVGRPEEVVWCIAGDGGIQMTIQELATIAQENIEVKIAVIDNRFLGMVRQWQEFFYDKRYVATPLSGPDLMKIAEAYGIAGERVGRKGEVAPAIERAMEHPGPFLIDFVVRSEENVHPMVPPGGSLTDFVEPLPEVLSLLR
jgi:acetolactate synthase-1/2/3 large subunit